MGYATAAEISSDFKDMVFTDTTNVKAADVDGFILESDALINSYIGLRYVTPHVAAGEGLTFLKLLSRSLTAARIKKIMEVVQAKGTDANQNILSVLLSPKDVMAILKDIREGRLNLAGGVLIAGAAGNGGFFSKNISNDIQTTIKKDEKQW